ncbi:type IV pilin-like G/H family protein [Leptolyngbya sp. FACHB-321]|uniref:type IV pilin-like G/H family protein n=1 Tax=Leptolyngbya sp. FACHB-321 TaxID=2692807 RepID=UPI001688E6E0|nr:type IV pilin-like G/H family protein [Leptolyngbya sp. FACHB-321]MBD2034432.1 type IV pilin-like G/H family protein [Leptolyngbya sp. FACHB-321]
MLTLVLFIIALVLLFNRTGSARLRALGLVPLILGLWVWVGVWNCSNIREIFALRETKTNVGSMNRAQEAHYLEKGKFSDSLGPLGLGLQPISKYAVYSVRSTTDAAFQYGTTRPDCRLCKVSLYDWLPSFLQTRCHSGPCLSSIPCTSRSYAYAGVAHTQRVADKVTFQSVLCEAKERGTVQLNPTYRNGIVDCGSNAKPISVRRTIVGEGWSETVDCKENTPGTVQRDLIDRRNGVVNCGSDAKKVK